MKLLTKPAILPILLLACVLVFSGTAGAQDSSAQESALCTSLSQRNSARIAALQNTKSAFETAKQRKLTDRSSARSQLDQQIIESRLAADEARANSFELFLEKQSEQGHTDAATAYKTAVESAVATRRAAFDAARAEFRKAADIFFFDYTGEARQRIDSFESSSGSAFAAASTACKRSRPNLSIARSEFVESLKTAKSDYEVYRQTRREYATAIKALIQTRNDAYKEATRQFQLSMLQARENFAAAKAID